jgi:hypothetical protein
VSSLAPSRPIRQKSDLDSASNQYLTVRLLLAISNFVNTHGWALFAMTSLACGWSAIGGMASRHLDHDELFTYYIAQAPSLHQLFSLTHTIDLHPPLSYLLVRASFGVFGVSSWSCRLPFFLAFLGASALVFLFVKRLFAPVYGIIAVLFLWMSPYSRLATEARPYAMMLCFTALLLVSWSEIVEAGVAGDGEGPNLWAFAGVVAAGFGLLLSHVLGVLAYGAFFATEVIRLWIRRKPDWRLWAALVLPLVSVLTYLPLIRERSGILFSEYSQASPRRLAICYWEHLRFLITPLILIASIALLWSFMSKRRHDSWRPASLGAIASVWSLLLLLFLVPLEIEFLFARTGTPFYERYGVVAMIPCAVIPVLVLGYYTGRNRLVAIGVAILSAALLILGTSGKAWLVGQLSGIAPPKAAARLLYLIALPPISPPPLKGPTTPSRIEGSLSTAPAILHLGALEPNLPLVAGSGPTFLELDRYETSALTKRLYLLTDHVASSTIVHNTVFDHYELVKAAFPIGGQVEPYCEFLRDHSQFLVLGGYNYPDTWILRKLEMDGAALEIVGTYDDGVIEEHQIYRIDAGSRKCATHL